MGWGHSDASTRAAETQNKVLRDSRTRGPQVIYLPLRKLGPFKNQPFRTSPSGSVASKKPSNPAQNPSRVLRVYSAPFPPCLPLSMTTSSFFPSRFATGLVPISIGAQAIDPLTGEPGPVIGAQTDPSAGVVVPIVQVLEALPRGVRDPGLVRRSHLFYSFFHSSSSYVRSTL